MQMPENLKLKIARLLFLYQFVMFKNICEAYPDVQFYVTNIQFLECLMQSIDHLDYLGNYNSTLCVLLV